MRNLILLFTFLAIMLFFTGLFTMIYLKRKYILRLSDYLKSEKTEEEAEISFKENMRKALIQISIKVTTLFRLKKLTSKLDILLMQADIPIRGEELSLILFMIFLISTFIVNIITGDIFSALIIGALFYYVPMLLIKTKVKSRIKEINNQLGDAIILISNSLRAGYSFMQAIGTVSEEMPDPIRKEFEILLKEMNMGVPTEKALNNMVSRVQSKDLDLVVTAVLIQRQVGGNLSEILDNISSTIRQRVKMKGEIRTLTAQGRMSGWIISALPIVLTLILYVINKEYIVLLFQNPIGNVMLFMGAIMQIIGAVVIKRIVNIEI